MTQSKYFIEWVLTLKNILLIQDALRLQKLASIRISGFDQLLQHEDILVHNQLARSCNDPESRKSMQLIKLEV